MFASLRRLLRTAAVCLSLLISVFALAGQSSPVQSKQQYQTAVQQAVNGPFRVDVQPVQQGVKQGSSAVLKVQLHNANNELVNASDKMTFVVKVWSPGGKEQTHSLEIAPGSNSGEVTVQAVEAGLWKLEVRESNDHLVSGSSYLLVSAPQQVKKNIQKPARRALKPKPTGGAFMFAPRLILAAYHPQIPAPDSSAASSSKPKIILTVSGDADNKVPADGIIAADVALFLSAPQPRDYQVSLSVSQGQVVPQMVTIKAGEVQGAAKWTSKTIAENATISIKDVTPRIDTEMVSQIISFIDPIVKIVFSNTLEFMNIVERGTIAVQFLDRNSTPVPAHVPLSFSFSANSPHLNVVPVSSQTKPDAVDFQASIIPSGFGTVTIQATVPHLKPITQTIRVTGALLLTDLMCSGRRTRRSGESP